MNKLKKSSRERAMRIRHAGIIKEVSRQRVRYQGADTTEKSPTYIWCIAVKVNRIFTDCYIVFEMGNERPVIRGDKVEEGMKVCKGDKITNI